MKPNQTSQSELPEEIQSSLDVVEAKETNDYVFIEDLSDFLG